MSRALAGFRAKYTGKALHGPRRLGPDVQLVDVPADEDLRVSQAERKGSYHEVCDLKGNPPRVSLTSYAK